MDQFRNIYDTRTLLGVFEDFEEVPNYWLNLCFPRQVNFESEYIEFEKLTNQRKLAPFVAPTAKGVAIASKRSRVTKLRPAYIKPKDAIEATSMIARRPGSLSVVADPTPLQNYQAHVVDYARQHREAIERRWEWLAARAIIDGKVTIFDDEYPEREIDFDRNPANTVTLTGTARWGQSGADIIGDIEGWRYQIRQAKFGGPTNRITVGANVWDVMRRDAGLLKQLDTQIRGTTGQFETGLRDGETVEYAGRLSTNLDIYIYQDYYEDKNGDVVEFMSPNDIVLTGPNINGVRCFGAIQDIGAQMRALPIFPKMWEEHDPSATVMMSQSAPLMVPVNPDNTLKATVL